MTYEEFQQVLKSEVQKECGNETNVNIHAIRKNNGVVRKAIEIRRNPDILTPSIYLEHFYSEYQKGVPIAQIAGIVLEENANYSAKSNLPENFFMVYEDVAPSIYCRLVNRERNRAFLLEHPFDIWQDLAVIYYYQVDEAILPDSSITIRNEHLAYWGIDEDTLRKQAWKNTRADHRIIFQTLGSALREMSGQPQECPDTEENPLYLLTNVQKCFGAVCICDKSVLHNAANWLNQSYYILPSSIHECLLLADNGCYDAEELSEMVREINRTQLSPQEILSDHVYYYDMHSDIVINCDSSGNPEKQRPVQIDSLTS